MRTVHVVALLAWCFAGVSFAQMSPDEAMKLMRDREAAAKAQAARGSSAAAARPGEGVPLYYSIPLQGAIGAEVRAEAVKQALLQAKASGATYAILSLDTEGGSAAEKSAIIKVIQSAPPELKIIAYVRQALGAGGVIALACPQIVMTPDGRLGPAPPAPAPGTPPAAETPVRSSRFGVSSAEPTPTAQPAFTAADRAALHPSHDPVLAAGMWNPAVQLVLLLDNGTPRIIDSAAAPPPGGKVLKPAGALLCLSAAQASECGLSLGTASDEDAIRAALNLPAWKSAGSAAVFMAQQARQGRHQAYADSIAPRLQQIDDELAKARASGRAAEQAYNDQMRPIAAQKAALDANAARLAAVANANGDPGIAKTADAIKTYRVGELDERTAQQTAALKGQAQHWADEQTRLLAERKALLEGGPK